MLKSLNLMLCEIEIMLRFISADVYEIAEKLRKKFNELDFLDIVGQNSTVSFAEEWHNAVYKSRLPLSVGDRAFISSIGENLGKSDLEGQLCIISAEKAELSSMTECAVKDCEKKCKLYRTLGILGGIFVLLII